MIAAIKQWRTSMLDVFTLLSKFRDVNNRESESAFFLTHVPSVAPLAYLNIIFKTAPHDVLADVGARLKIPVPILGFLERYNGIILFCNSLCVFGVHRKGQLLNRTDRFAALPYNIENESLHFAPSDRRRFFKFGAYGYDGSGVCMNRDDHSISVFRRREEAPYRVWPSLEDWLESEIQRLSKMFDETGIWLVDESETLPPPDTGGASG
jgi:hypothetical protein